MVKIEETTKAEKTIPQDNDIVLGGKIKLVGFRELEPAKLIVAKKLIGSHVKKINDVAKNFEEISITLKPIHGDNGKYEIHSKVMDNGKPVTSESTDFNLFVTLSDVLEKTYNEMHKD